jgi:hypothetical protein
MSKLIYENPWLVSQLLQAGLESEAKLAKKGQAAPTAQPEQPIATALKSILNNLKNQITPGKDPGGSITHETSGADVFSHNMDSMGDLVQWLSSNGTRFGGGTIVYPGNRERPSDDYGYFKIEPGTEIVVPLATPDRSVVAYWINPEALKNYLVSLQGDPKLKNNVMFQVQLLKLIQDANTQLDLDISEQYKEPEKTLPDSTVADNTTQELNPTQYSTQGNIPLTLGDLKDSTTLNAWLSNKKIGLNIGGHTGGMMINHPEFDHCAVLKILNQRAAFNAARATSADAKAVAAAYAQKVKAIAAEIRCDLGGQQQPGQEKPGGAGGGLAAASPQILMQLSSLKPFNSQYISFPELTKFLTLYGQYANDPAVTDMVNKLDAGMKKFKSYYSGTDTINLYNMTKDQFKSMLQNGSYATIAADQLMEVIMYAGQLYQRLVNSLQTIAQDPARGKYIDYRAMQQQITPGGPQTANMDTLNRLRYSIDQEVKSQK